MRENSRGTEFKWLGGNAKAEVKGVNWVKSEKKCINGRGKHRFKGSGAGKILVPLRNGKEVSGWTKGDTR